MLKFLKRLLFDEQGSTLAMVYQFSPNTLISSSQMNANMDAIIAVVNALTAENYSADSVGATALNSDVVRTDYGLSQHTTGALQVDLSDTSPSLELTDGGLRAKVDNSSIERASGGLQVKALGITNAMLAGTITDDKLSQLTTADKVANAALVQITTASKVSGTAVTLLTSVPAAAGILPVANGSTGKTLFQSGVTTLNQGADTTITFPIAFANTDYVFVDALMNASVGVNHVIRSKAVGSLVYSNNAGEAVTLNWIAVGTA